MMREIKFRAWHKTEEKMYRVLSLVLAQREQEVVLVRYEGPYVTCPLDEVELMQYTGLKDRNHAKIYEGDIVKHVTHRFNGVVFFERGCFWVRECLSHVDADLRNGNEEDTQWSIDLEWEIVGNQYETPELIQSKW